MKKKYSLKGLGDDFDMVLWGIFFDKLLENLEAYVMVSDSDGRIIFANSRCQNFFSSVEDGLLGRKWPENIIPPTKRKEVLKIFDRIKKRDKLTRFDTPVMATANLDKYCRCISVPLKENEGRLYMFLLKEGGDVARRVTEMWETEDNALTTNYRNIIQALFDASMEADAATAIHSTRVMSFAVILARKMQLDKESLRKLRVACLLHDLGKIAIDDKILNKKGKLTDEEYDQIKKHPRWGAELMQLVYFLEDVIPIVATHHENYGGGGYPEDLRKDQIPLESRILAVADIYEALTADRPYRKGYSREEALRIMEEESGEKLDPEITDIFISLVRNERFREDGIDR